MGKSKNPNLLKAVWSKYSGKIAKIHPVLYVMFSNFYQELARVLQQAVMSIRQFFKEFFQVTFLLQVVSRVQEKQEKKKRMYKVFFIAANLLTWVSKQCELKFTPASAQRHTTPPFSSGNVHVSPEAHPGHHRHHFILTFML